MSKPVKDRDAVALPVSFSFSELSAGGELTAEAIIAKLFVSDSDLSSKTRISEPVPLAICDTLAVYAEERGLTKTSKTLEAFLKSLRENYRSVGGWLVGEAKEMLMADLERSAREGEGMGERLIGGRGKR